MVKTNIGENIKNIRKEQKMSQTTLANKLGYCDKSMISKIEHGVVDLNQTRILEFANALGVDATEILGIENGYTEEENELFKIFNHLNKEGQEELLKYARLLKASDQYKKHNSIRLVEENA